MDLQKSDNLEVLIRYETMKGKIKTITEEQKISEIIKDYFTSQQLSLSYEQLSLFEENFYEDKINSYFQKWLQKVQKANQYHLDQFLRFWINHDDKLKLIYKEKESQQLSQLQKKSQNKIKSQKINETGKELTEKNEEFLEEKVEENSEKNNNNQISHPSTPLNNSLRTNLEIENGESKIKKNQDKRELWEKNLEKIYKHFCSKIEKTPNGSTFDSIQKLFSTMNLTQWISFCKYFKLINYKTETNTLTSIHLAKVFQKHEQNNKRFIFTDFRQAIFQILKEMFAEEQSQTKGFQFLHIHTQSAFNEKMKSIGVKVPENKVLFKPINKTIHCNSIKERAITRKEQLAEKVVPQEKPKFYRSREERKQEQMMSKLSLQNLSKLKISDNIEKKLKNMAGGEDIYLKRYGKQKNGKRSEQNGVIGRMDKRINNVITKMR